MNRPRPILVHYCIASAIGWLHFASSALLLTASSWPDSLLQVPYPLRTAEEAEKRPVLRLLRQDFEELEINRSVVKTPMQIGIKRFGRGLGTHSIGHIRVESPEPMARFSASVGVDHNDRTRGGKGSVVFVVLADAHERYRSEVLRGGQEPKVVDVDLGGALVLDLQVGDAGDGPACDHADWAEAKITTRDGRVLWLDEMPRARDTRLCRYPFSFLYGGLHSDELLPSWQKQTHSEPIDVDRTRTVMTWSDPKTGLRVEWQAIRFSDFPAVEWVVYFENTGTADTPILADVQALDLGLNEPRNSRGHKLASTACYLLHRTNGAPANPTDFEPKLVEIARGTVQTLGGGEGRSSDRDFPFLKIESEQASYILAVGWSGQWAAQLACRIDGQLHATAGLERTHFLLRKGERVRTPRILLLRWLGDTLESNAQFRQVLYKHYAARRNGQRVLPTLFCNTCFTRGGGWLNECNAQNQISLIRAYGPLGAEAVVTDAGWFEGGWPAGAGNWSPRRDAYPEGMGPVAKAAKSNGMVYGLWFEFERVADGTWLAKNRPAWLLKSASRPEGTYLLDLGLPEVRKYLINIVQGFMDLPGFAFYRSDFNMSPLPYWQHSDAPDRVGVTEMKYIEGLYTFWDELARRWPDSFREECASGGRRIDLETIERFHFHQKSDYWFDNEVDAAVVWSLSRYLPNSTFTTPLIRLDDRSFHSTFATSLVPGWIADAPGFDRARAKNLAEVYSRLRPLLVGAWYPLTGYSRDGSHWLAMQFHRPDLNEGLLVVIPPHSREDRKLIVTLHGLNPEALYELHWEITHRMYSAKGKDLMKQLELTLPEGDGGERIVYRMTSER